MARVGMTAVGIVTVMLGEKCVPLYRALCPPVTTLPYGPATVALHAQVSVHFIFLEAGCFLAAERKRHH